MKSYETILDNAKQLEAVCNSFGVDNQVKKAIDLFGEREMLMISGCFIRQIHRESADDFKGYCGGSIMMDDRNAASFESAKQLMNDPEFASELEQLTIFFTPLGEKEMRFNYCERIYIRMCMDEQDNHIEATVVALYFTQVHRTLQQNLFRVCCNLLREKGYIDGTTKIYLPYI